MWGILSKKVFFLFVCFREHCLAVKDLYCYKEWLSMEDNSRKGIYTSGLRLSLPDCNHLPSMQKNLSTCTGVPFIGTQETLFIITTIALALTNAVSVCDVPLGGHDNLSM